MAVHVGTMHSHWYRSRCSVGVWDRLRNDSTKSEEDAPVGCPPLSLQRQMSLPDNHSGGLEEGAGGRAPAHHTPTPTPYQRRTTQADGTLLSPVTNPADLALLAKLEEENRRLEADRKSLQSLSTQSIKSHSRGGSISSIISNTSVCSSSSAQHGEDQGVSHENNAWDTWGKLVNDWDSVAKKKAGLIKELVKKGVPHHFRGIVWQLLCNAHECPEKELFADYLKMTSPSEKMIRRDITRTYPEHDFFREKNGLGQESLFNVMKAYSLHDREVGYCQGSGFIVGLILMLMPEEEAFAVTVKIMQDYKMRDVFKPSMAELGLCMFQLECMIQEQLPQLYSHFQAQSFYVSMFASSWFLTLFTQTLPLPVACRIFDVFLVEGLEVVFRVGFAILQLTMNEMLSRDMEGMLRFLQKDMPALIEEDPDTLMQTAFQVKFNTKKMKKLEKEYNALKTKEQEEQVELRRLRTENRLLRQRIDNLEKETGTLADRLIQDQVKYAQQEEELYVLRRDVKAARQQSREANDRVAEVTTQYEELQGKANGSGESPEEAHSKDEQILELRHELRESRYQESESKAAQGELRGKIRELENMVRQLEKEPSAEMQHLQEELIACKLREAEANLSLKELQQKVNELDRHWQKHVEKLQTPPSGSTSKPSKERLQHYENELMTVRIREASAISELKEVKLRLMELETENHICGRQIKRLEDENTRVKEDLETRQSKEREKEHQAKEVERRISDIESKRREDVMMVKIKDAEYAQSIAEMRRRIAELEIENQELITAGQLQERGDRQDLEQRVSDLLEEVQQLKMARRLQSLSSLALNNINLDTESDYDTDELEASRLKLPEGVSLNTGNGLPRPMLPELNIDTSSCSDSDDYPIHSSESAPGRADRKQGAAMLDAHRGGGKGRVTAHARRKKRASLMKDHRVTSEIDYDRTPTQDSVNNGIFVLGNGVEATTLPSNGIDSGSRSGSGSGSGSAEPPADETSTSVMADDNTAGRPNPTT